MARADFLLARYLPDCHNLIIELAQQSLRTNASLNSDEEAAVTKRNVLSDARCFSE